MPMMIRPKRAMKASLKRQIASAMKYRGFTVERLADEMGTTPGQVKFWIKGNCTVSTLWDMASAMRVTFYVEFSHL
jgi:predicted transcriptional regulator